jgi:ADP-dependent phosphofructokinase/glucokinase
MTVDNPLLYAETANKIITAAPTAAPLLAGFSTCIDQLHHLDGSRLDALADVAAATEGALSCLAREVLSRISAGRDGEVFVPAPELQPVLDALLGAPATRQVGGTGAQAAWVLATLGAASVLALADRSAAQLAVLDSRIGVCGVGAVRPVGVVPDEGTQAKPPHFILEYTAGTQWGGGTVPRSSRIIVRLAADGVERDARFAALSPGLAATAGAGLVSGMNSIAEDDDDSRRWLQDLVTGWRRTDLPLIHLELAEYPHPDALAGVVRGYAGLVHSVGLSLAELSAFVPGADPVTAARRIAAVFRADRVCVHADTWSLAVHRGAPGPAVAALRAANLLAAARARHGVPTRDLSLDAAATFTDDLPACGPAPGGWRADCVPTPYLARPAATVGLGDTFVAGLLLASCIDAVGDVPDHRPPADEPHHVELETHR